MKEHESRQKIRLNLWKINLKGRMISPEVELMNSESRKNETKRRKLIDHIEPQGNFEHNVSSEGRKLKEG